MAHKSLLIASALIMLMALASQANTSENEDPFDSVVQILTIEQNKLKFLCTGVVIEPDVVLTAASCLSADVNPLKIAMIYTTPSVDLKLPLRYSDLARKGISHPKSDLMLLFLDRRLDVKPAKFLSRTNSYTEDCSDVILAGYGIAGIESVRENFVTTGRVVDDETILVNRYPDILFTSCMGNVGVLIFAMVGDAPHLVGLLTHSAKQATCAQLSKGLRLDAFRKFINETIAEERWAVTQAICPYKPDHP